MVQAKGVVTKMALSVVLALSLCSLAASPAFAAGSKAGTKKISVVTKIGETSYSYNAKGLIAKTRTSWGITTKYKYSGTKIVSAKSSDGSTVKASYKGGRISKVTYKWKGLNSKITDTYKYKKGRVVQATRKNAGNYLVKYSYDKKGRLSKVTENFRITKTKVEKYTTSLKYDSKGYVVQEKHKDGAYKFTNKFQNTYANGVLVKRQLKGIPESAEEITYKTISVPSKYVKKVKAQQAALFTAYGKDQDPLFF